jgi:hypothetical protein
MELSNVLRKVRALIDRAEHPETPPQEAATARATADRLMEKYAVEEWEALKSGGATGLKPDKIKIDIGEEGDPFLERMAMLVNVVASHCRATSVWLQGSGRKGYRKESCWVYGYQSDLRYFELLYTTLHLHMAGALLPAPDPSLSMGENAYNFRQAGLNWIEIAVAWGWYEVERRDGEARNMYQNRDKGDERFSWAKSVGRIKKAALAEYAARGEAPPRIPPSAALNFRYNAINGYIAKIGQRLREARAARGVGAEIVLRDRSQNIAAAIAEDYPTLGHAKAETTRYNAEAYRRGVNHAATASLNPEATGGSAPAVGA